MTRRTPEDRRTTEPTLLHTIDALLDDGATGFTFLDDDHSPVALTWAELATDARARAGEFLEAGLKPGDRIGLLLTDTRLFVSCFLGAIRAGLVPIPMAPPFRMDVVEAWCEGARRILEVGRAVAVCTQPSLVSVAYSLVHGPTRQVLSVSVGPRVSSSPPLPDPASWAAEHVAFLQFTSGSTSAPKGVRTTHANLAANSHAIMVERLGAGPDDVGVSWLPLFHDMGLIGFVISPLRHRMPTVYFPPYRFVMRPALWMQTISTWRGTVTFAPNFAFALAVKRTPSVAGLDLSRLRVVGCGAEPIDARVMERFVAHFAPAGFRPEALMPCYGMAEATLAMSFDRLDRPFGVDRVDPDVYRAEGRATESARADALAFVSCGVPLPGHDVVVRAEDGTQLPDRHVGELYFLGPSVADGYDSSEQATKENFTAVGLRTGDLGYCVNGEVFVTGRRKDLLIIAGRNFDPQDVERQVSTLEQVREGNVIAFTVDAEEGEALVVVAETRAAPGEYEALTASVRLLLQQRLGLRAHEVCLVAPGSLPKTSSGKLQRSKTRLQYLEGTLSRSAPTVRRALSLARFAVRNVAGRVKHTLRNR